MKIVKAPRTQKDAKEMYKVGNVITDEFEYYLVVEGDRGYALVSLSNNSVGMKKDSLSELANSAWHDGDKLVDAELRILK